MKWACPKCGAGVDEHGNGQCLQTGHLHSGFGSSCSGFLCECDDNLASKLPDHGESLKNPCEDAHCYHCGWSGKFPVPPKGMQGWEKKAIAAGWTPPEARKKELGIT